jgi:D-serine deaminase-like pyridoxal phosphate-dependent protein
MNTYDSVFGPALLIHERICRENIRWMQQKADRSGCRLIPHFKTHQSAGVGSWFRDAGTDAITVSSVSMASFFADNGWSDITVAFPVNIREIGAINRLAGSVRLRVFVNSVDAARFLASRLLHAVDFYMEIDTGYGRTGVAFDDAELIDAILDEAGRTDLLRFAGFYTHDGNTYDVRGTEAVLGIHHATRARLMALRERYRARYPDLLISMGDTPGCSLAEDFAGIDEVRPGNYVYYDVTQTVIGSCRPDQIGVLLAAPVVARHQARYELVVFGGAVHLSKDSVVINGQTIYGQIADLKDGGWSAPLPGCHIRKLSQEHGIISVTPEVFERYRVGDLIGILPVHSCLTMDLMRFNGRIMVTG